VTGVSRRTFFILFALVVLALLGLALLLFLGAFAVHGTNASSVGAVGPAGPRGATGPRGAVGPSGAPGASGSSGATGATGARGSSGTSHLVTHPIDGGTYHVSAADLTNSLVEIPTSNISQNSSTISSTYLAGATPVMNSKNVAVGTFSVTYLSLQSADGITTEIESHLSTANGLVVDWDTQASPSNLQLDSVVGSMSTQSVVSVSTKVGSSVYYGHTFTLVVSQSGDVIDFAFGART
jgi:hypothetical protein